MPDPNELQSAANLALTLAWSTGKRGRAFDDCVDSEDDLLGSNGRTGG
jgi:hypothetical protein